MTENPTVEILYFEDCPNWPGAVELVERVARAVGVEPDVRVAVVEDDAAAAREKFLGSPTIRVNGRDVEPGAEARTDYVLSCRVYRTEEGLRGQPDECWVRDALLHSA